MIRIVEPTFSEEEKRAVLEIIESHQITRGRWTQTFQEEFARFLGVEHCFTVCSGTVALFIALKALGVDKGDRVIVPAMSFMATIDSVYLACGEPVVVDVDEYFTMDLNQLEDAVKRYSPKVVMPVHLYGGMADMENIMFLADRYGFYVVEDSAQAHGAQLKDKKAGAWGHIGAFSFYASKNVPMGEGGALTTDDPEIARKIKQWIDFGEHPAFNVRITEFQAAIGTLQLRKLKERNERRRAIAKKYTELLSEHFKTPKERPHSYHVYHLYTLMHPERERVVEELGNREIDARVYYTYLLHELRNAEHLPTPNAERFRREVFSIPVHPYLKDQEVELIIGTLLNSVSSGKIV
ncbi:dTDP-4-amino-4,6-dideoxygalactose transaminase [Hydrogenivirga caldilitoris]|uniref:dTDP-4-amino-4,6-dideoxygalactose transaminase n=1 Tax=Hydrogenivirga caldilitoris TaxID=246264 RepID=A0A497XMD3_9AQUI|nr:DegT/DnrJ/EryC1/StrS family aminotransferase [Hydrogenivirga caldilitoris]RLJ70076.1 dTDP-4-amino-4,6-dideoxygalactose transaminase [Hydrogenivirga caldilitoris]